MGQNEILGFLHTARASGDQSFFTPKEIAKALKDRGEEYCNVSFKCTQLYDFGFLERRFVGWLRPSYRLRASFVKK